MENTRREFIPESRGNGLNAPLWGAESAHGFVGRKYAVPKGPTKRETQRKALPMPLPDIDWNQCWRQAHAETYYFSVIVRDEAGNKAADTSNSQATTTPLSLPS